MYKRIHFIEIGEAIMTDLAIALHELSCEITCSNISEPDYSLFCKLIVKGLLPKQYGFSEHNIDNSIEAVIVGNKVDDSNIEFQTAKALGIPVYTYTEFVYNYAQDKQRIVVIGDPDSANMVFEQTIYAMSYAYRDFDYVVESNKSASSVKLSDSPVIFLQANIHALSYIDQRPQAMVYKPHILLLLNLDTKFCKDKTYSNLYLNYLNDLADSLPKAGTLLYNKDIPEIQKIGSKQRTDIKSIPFKAHDIETHVERTCLKAPLAFMQPIPRTDKLYLQIISGSHMLSKELAINDQDYYQAINHYMGTL